MSMTVLACMASALLLGGCATVEARHPFVDADAPHAVLDFTVPPPGGDLTPARLFTVDGIIGPASANRLSYWVTPGEHELTIYGEAWARDKVGIPARGKKDPGKVVMNFDAGRRYYIAILWLSDARNDWRPTIWKVE